MATPIHFRNSKTQPRAIPQDGYRDMTVGNALDTGVQLNTDVVETTEKSFVSATIPIAWWSERVAAQVTISGEITFSFRASTGAGFTGRLRAKLYKITAGGSNVETLIGQADAAADLVTTQTTYVFSFTPAAAITIAPNERFICRPTVMPVEGSFGVSTAGLHFHSGSTQTCSVTFTETVTFKANGLTLALRGTDSGIENFYELLAQRTTGPILTGVVATTPGGTEIQWTRSVKIARDVTGMEIQSTSNAATYVSPGSFIPVANRLYLLAVVHSDAAPESTVPTVTTTTGLAFVQVGSSMPFSTIASPGLRLTVFRAQKASGLSLGDYTVTLADAGTGCATRLIEVLSMVATGADGADAVLNVSTNSNNASANPSVSMGAFDDAINPTLLFVGSNIATVPTGGTGITVLGHSTYATPTGSVAAAWNSDNDTAPDLVLASSAWAAIAVELVVDPALLEALEWITQRFKAPGWSVDSLGMFGSPVLYTFESDVAANCTQRIKVFRRTPAGVETLVVTWTYTTVEMSTTLGTFTHTAAMAVLAQATNFAEDDRLVFRVYAIPFTALTMGGGHTCTLEYDKAGGGVSDSRLLFLDAPEFKASGDPDADPSALPSRLPLMGA